MWWQESRQHDPHSAYGRFQLPAFDAYVYVAMAERPRVFTVAPWGYRVLAPAVVGLLGFRNVVRGFRIESFAAMAAAGAALFAFLRRRGHAPGAAVLGVALFGLSPPMARAVETPFFLEPMGILLLLALLGAIESGAGWGVFALLAALETLAKDGALVVSLVPAILVSRWSQGRPRALAAAAAAAAPALLLTSLLRAWWTPHIASVSAPLDLDTARAALGALEEAWPATALAALVGGLVPLAALGAWSPPGRAFLRRYGLSLALLVGMALVAWLKVPSREPVPLFGANFERLLVYAVPLLVPLALAAIDRLWPSVGSPAPPRRPRPQALPAVGAVLALMAPFLLVDRYRRIDLKGSRDGPLVLAVCRETWRTATRLAKGDTVAFTPESHRFAWGETDPGQLGHMRWFLREGWGERAHYGTGEIVMHEPSASLLLPLWRPAEVEAVVRVAARGTVLALAANGRVIDTWATGPDAPPHAVRLPAATLFRGDNVVTLSAPGGERSARLREVSYRVVAP